MKAKKEEITEERFTKEQIVSSEKYKKNKDILTAILKQDETYTKEEVENTIQEFLKRRVK